MILTKNHITFVLINNIMDALSLTFIFFVVNLSLLNFPLFHHLEIFCLLLGFVHIDPFLYMCSPDIINIELNNISKKPSYLSFHEALENLLLNKLLLIVFNRVYTHVLYFPVSRVDSIDKQFEHSHSLLESDKRDLGSYSHYQVFQVDLAVQLVLVHSDYLLHLIVWDYFFPCLLSQQFARLLVHQLKHFTS